MKGVTRPSEREFLDLNCYKIYEGTKQFWRHNLSMEIILVEHCTVNTIEVICYCQELEQEAKRLYIDYHGIVQTVQEPISDNLKIKSQLLLRQNLSDLQIAEILHSYELDLQCELSCESIVNRVDVLSLDPSFQISLRVTYGDELDSSKKKLCFTIDKPKQLIPYYSHKRIKVVR